MRVGVWEFTEGGMTKTPTLAIKALEDGSGDA